MRREAAVVQFQLFYEDYETFPIYPCFVGGDWRKTFGVSCKNLSSSLFLVFLLQTVS